MNDIQAFCVNHTIDRSSYLQYINTSNNPILATFNPKYSLNMVQFKIIMNEQYLYIESYKKACYIEANNIERVCRIIY